MVYKDTIKTINRSTTNKMIEQRLDYLHLNPVVAGFVNEPEHWRYSSAIDYAGGKGLLDICFIE